MYDRYSYVRIHAIEGRPSMGRRKALTHQEREALQARQAEALAKAQQESVEIRQDALLRVLQEWPRRAGDGEPSTQPEGLRPPAGRMA
jgi:hypothetical protein